MAEERAMYKKPESKEEAKTVLDNIPGKVYNRLKGRILGAIEMIYDNDKKSTKYVTFKNSLDLHLGTVTRGLKNEITDCIEVME